MPIAVALELRAGAAGSHFQATKRHVDSTTVRHQGRVIPLISPEEDFRGHLVLLRTARVRYGQKKSKRTDQRTEEDLSLLIQANRANDRRDPRTTLAILDQIDR